MKRKMNWLFILLSFLIFITNPAVIYGAEPAGEEEDRTLSPYFLIENGDPSVDHFPLKDTDVSTTINGIIAETYVTQTYTNEGTNPISASYVFPASTRVTIHGMKMEIGDKVVTAKIKEREVAKQEFEEAKNEGKSASLLEQQRPNVFTMNVANIMPGDTVKLELHYTEMVVSTDGVYQFAFPTVVGPRYASSSEDGGADSSQWVSSPYLKEGTESAGKYNITVRLSTGVPITDLKCKSHEIKVAKDSESVATVTLANPEDFAGNRDFILDYRLTGEDVSCGLMLNSGEDENFFMLMVQPPRRPDPQSVPPREYIFVLDVSGSMYGYPLDTARELIKNLVTSLKATDTFNLILFSGASMQMSPHSVNATEENVQNAIALIDRQDGGGGTELAPALEKAIAIPKTSDVSRSIVVITDGYISGEKEIFELINQNLATTSFFSFGTGSSVNRYLIDGIAKTGLGESFIVTDSEDAADTADRFRAYIDSPVLTDIHVTYDGFDAYDVEPPVLSTLFARRPIVLFGKWRGNPSGTIRITGKTGNGDYVQEVRISDAEPSKSNSAIRYLWARTKAERLTDYGFTKDDDTVKQEITSLGLKYSMMTPYTSFIAVIDTIRNESKKSTDVNQPSSLPLHVSDLAVGGGYTIGSEPGILLLIIVMLTIVLIGILCRSRNRKLTNLENEARKRNMEKTEETESHFKGIDMADPK